MNPALRTSASGMIAQQRMIDVIANNLANVNTTAFKRSRATFEDVLYETLQGESLVNYQSNETVAPIQVGKGVRVANVLRFHQQGTVGQTGRPFDLAIEGDGFFQIQRPDGSLGYTRDGSFTLSNTGALVTGSGYLVQPGITIPADAASVTISPNGIVAVQSGEAGAAPVEIGRVELVRFANPTGLESLGENLYRETVASGQPITGQPQDAGFGRVVQGALEGSNVEIVVEMTDMIAAQRAYEINAKAIRATDDMMQSTNDLVR
ncbi:MAG: flagellar basal-body rod protein FlgG [Gemmatimonadales bacterium]|nr:flagellar basal-body rod protein FlgG [Gemmatimonadota bacterium]MDX2057822.1 flagellar basal-body rod protein FlgG [Gemmatimonadales bacterium]